MSRKDRRRQEQIEESAAEQRIMEERSDSGSTVRIPSLHVTHEPFSSSDNARNVTANRFSCSIHGKDLFKDTQVNFLAGMRYGLMGPNGRGKSTLLRVIEQRRIPIGTKLQIQLVEQEQETQEMDTSAVDVVLRSDKLRIRLLAEEALLLKVENPTDDQHKRLLDVQDDLAARGESASESRARRVLFGLGFSSEWQSWPTRRFSGGWRKRIALACAVFVEPDFLMLDEPTNHLDLNAVMWLQSYLSQVYNVDGSRRPKTLVIVSHDVEFLDSVWSISITMC